MLLLEVSRRTSSLTPQAMTLVPPANRAELGPPNGPLVVVVILNWNNPADILECVESDDPRLAAWVVDNGSDEDPTGRLGERFPRVQVIRLAHNVGRNAHGLISALAPDRVPAKVVNAKRSSAPRSRFSGNGLSATTTVAGVAWMDNLLAGQGERVRRVAATAVVHAIVENAGDRLRAAMAHRRTEP